MMICRFPEIFELTVSKNGQRLGFTFEKPAGQAEIRITSILPQGAVADSNKIMIKSMNWHRVVLPEMRIVAVNAVEGDANIMATELRNCETAKFRIRRPNELAEELHCDEPAATAGRNESSSFELQSHHMLSGGDGDQDPAIISPTSDELHPSPREEQKSYRPSAPDFW